MTEVNVSTRIPKILEKKLEDYMKIEHLEKSAAIRKLLFKSLQDWREEYAMRLLEEGKTTISRAAEIANMDIWSFIAKLKKFKIKWTSEEIIDRDLESFR